MFCVCVLENTLNIQGLKYYDGFKGHFAYTMYIQSSTWCSSLYRYYMNIESFVSVIYLSLSFHPSLYRNAASAHLISTHNVITFIFSESIQNLIWRQVKKPSQSIYVTNEKKNPIHTPLAKIQLQHQIYLRTYWI